MSNIWFASDFHIGHEGIISLCNRPFPNVDVMDTTIINNFNQLVAPTDTVYFLGDFSYRCKDIEGRLRQLGYDGWKSINGIWHFYKGNHDKFKYFGDGFFEFMCRKYHGDIPYCLEDALNIKDEITVEIEEDDGVIPQQIVLNHEPMLSWGGIGHGVWHLYGHMHNNPFEHPATFAMNVSVEVADYKPVSLQQVHEHMVKRFLEKGMVI